MFWCLFYLYSFTFPNKVGKERVSVYKGRWLRRKRLRGIHWEILNIWMKMSYEWKCRQITQGTIAKIPEKWAYWWYKINDLFNGKTLRNIKKEDARSCKIKIDSSSEPLNNPQLKVHGAIPKVCEPNLTEIPS